jgi:hypothetical protein
MLDPPASNNGPPSPVIVCRIRSVGEVTGSTTGALTPHDEGVGGLAVGVLVGVGELRVAVGVIDSVNVGGVLVGVAHATPWLAKATDTKPANAAYNQCPVGPGRKRLLRTSISPSFRGFHRLGRWKPRRPFTPLTMQRPTAAQPLSRSASAQAPG